MTYQVMIAAPTAALEQALTARFEELSDAEVVSVHRTSREVSDTVGKLPGLDVVLIHEDLGPLPVLDLVRDISRNHPQLAVILIVNEVEPDTFTNAMEAGARGLLQADATIEQLSARVTTAAEWSRTLRRHLEAASLDVPVTGRRGSIITFTGAKGGVGTTTTAIHLARIAARAGRVVCLVDLDLQTGDIPGYFDLKHRRSIVDLVEAADDISAAMLADTLYVHPDGLHILLAPVEGERGEDVTARASRQILGALRSRFDLVIVDCGSAMTEATAMAVELSDTAVVLVNPDLPALRGAQRLIAMWNRLQIRASENVTTLLMRHSRRNEIQPDFARKLLGGSMLRTPVPAAYRALEEASNTGAPDRLTDESLLKAFGRLAGELGMLTVPAPDDAATDAALAGAGENPATVATPARGRPSRHARSDSGSLIVEFAAVLPFLGLALLIAWQVLLVGLTGMYAGHAANEGARQAAITPDDPAAIREEAVKRVRAPWDGEDTLDVAVVQREGRSFVRVTIATPAVIPGVDSPWDISSEALIIPER
ncbi:AAA family ATPase [Marinitenerispora sediminis]|uniref:Septum formation initiator n=1 Tax=Marinitenerispora sediminis TaxID=1931232 RepID=A0A368T7P2_9ACTN|nr:AAA family ATPase [Marinitenerispora sediminis]RCV57953.1 septum formation initiator [Marinitenerispora sediminis]RCV59703.1 septum formation initiator [Marinitenerispora sediminis]RCV62314.1 septum formation initiator [Marinitenerispora sediminis]